MSATDAKIRKTSNRSKSIRSLARNLGYTSHPGSNTLARFRRVLGPNSYSEISSGSRMSMPRKQWSKF